MTRKIFYWLTTALLALGYAAGGVVDIVQPAEVMEDASKLGYPSYFYTILGVWKLAAVVALLAPALPRLKEWAYAGIFFNLTGAAASHVFVKDPLPDVLTPMILLGIAMTSYFLRPTHRRLAGSWV